MKKTISVFLVFMAMSISVWAQSARNDKFDFEEASKIENGCYGLKWGCSSKDLKSKYPNASLVGKDKNGNDVYTIREKYFTRMFVFERNKMITYSTIYEGVSPTEIASLVLTLPLVYGKLYNRTENGDTTTWYYHYSNNVEVWLMADIKRYVVYITYVNINKAL